MNAENFSDMTDQLETQLEQLKIEKKDILSAQLLLEEIFWRMVNKDKDVQVKVQVLKKFFGKVQIQMTSENSPYNPLVEVADWNEDTDDDDYFTVMILKANRQKLNWLYKQNCNIVTINVRSKSNAQAIITIACIVGGLICGIISKLLVGQLIAALVMVTFFMIFICRVGKILFKLFAAKVSTLLPPTFATSSSSVVMPAMMQLCTDKLGIAPKISSFAIPIGTSLPQAGCMIYFITLCFMFLRMYGVELDLQTVVLVSFLSLALSFGAPAVPAAYVICVVTIVGYFGVPEEVAALMFCLDALSDRIATCVNLVSNTALTTVLARTENLLDEKIYFEN